MSEFKQAERTPRPNYGKYVFVLLLLFVGCVGSAGYFIFGRGGSESVNENQAKTEEPSIENKQPISATGGSSSSGKQDW